MKRILFAILGILMISGITACNKANEEKEEESFDLTATAWADTGGTLSIVFLANNGISMTTSKDGYIFVQGIRSIEGNTVTATFTDRQDGMDTGGIKTLDTPLVVTFSFNLSKDHKTATIPGGLSFLGYNSSISLERVR